MRTAESGDAAAPTLATLLRRFRLAAGFSQEKLAERAGLSVEAIGKLERGARRAPYASTIELLADALGLGQADRRVLVSAIDAHRKQQTAVERVAVVSLPSSLTRLVGRERELGIVQSFVAERSVRLLTITGVGGVGKTRFAVELAGRMQPAFEDGVGFVSLAAVRDPGQVPATLLQSVGYRDDDCPATLDTLCAHIAGRRLLLVIDNFEQVLSAGPLVAEVLKRCSHIVVFVTSREALQVSGEHEFQLEPLDAPTSLELMIDRALMVKPELEIEPQRDAFASICRRLEGLPLAIELAAARLRYYPPSVLLERLSARLDTLVAGPRDSPYRQHTMRNAIDWSYQLLNEGERTVFQIASLFARGGSLEALRSVADASMPIGSRTDDIIASLADKHLLSVRLDPTLESRFEMLETIGEYGAEQFEASGRLEHCRKWFAEHYAGLARRAAPHLRGPDAVPWLDTIGRDYQNVRAALGWAVVHDRTLGLHIALGIREFWKRRGYFAEPVEWLSALVDPSDPAIARENPELWWNAMNLLALSHFWAGKKEQAIVLYPLVLHVARQLDDPVLIARTLNNFGSALYDAGRVEEARQTLEESLTIKQRHDSDWSIATTCSNIGMALRACGAYELALAHHRRALDLFHSSGDRWGELAELNDIADVHRDAGAWAEAARHYRASLDANVEALRPLVADSLEGLAAVAAANGLYHHVAVLAGSSDTIHRETGRPIAGPDFPSFDAACNAARAALGNREFAKARSEGSALPLPEAIEIARAIAGELS